MSARWPGHVTWLQLVAAVVLLGLGFLFVVQVRAGRLLRAQPEVPTRNVYALATLLRQERDARADLERKVEELQRRQAEYERATAEGRTLASAMGKELESLRVAVGLKAMRGPGVVVTLADAKAQPAGSTPVVVTYQDLVSVINELWAAGAEAVAVNGQRVTATTGFGQVGGTIVVNLQRLTGPFTIAAIGDPATLEGALNIRGGLIDGLRAIGLLIAINRQTDLTVPAYRGVMKFEHARPVE
ncbi:MAG: DUF881 domain-containing protein [Firmicutes bacterium]|jgi:uncharacterized protein YlxW (UPF0749 family)|nr:DUF881 domain-containing protein [Bacillota bacterium]